MKNNIFKYDVNLVPLTIENKEQDIFRDELNNIPYLLYKVEDLSNGSVIAINKPGGKKNYRRFSQNDLMVFIFNKEEKTLWLISHDEISDDIQVKFEYNEKQAKLLLEALYNVCCGNEPDRIIKKLKLYDTVGLPVETLLKAYKWIWGQEDCNYPKGKGRWLSMDGLMKKFNLSYEDFK